MIEMTPDIAHGILDMFDYIKKKFSKKKVITEKKLSAKEQADRDKEPYIEILSIEVDSDDLGQGSFELDWNDIFVAKLVRAGYPGKTDQDIVDNWFKEVCRNVLLETYEQEQADPVNRKNPNNNGQR
jgi:hypothetical protein